MNNTVYLLSTSDLKSYSPLNANIDDALLNNAIMEAQEVELAQILGGCLYEAIIGMVYDGTISTRPEYKKLLDDYCRKVVVYAATMRASVYIRYKLMNKGVQSQNSDNSSPVELNELQFLMNHIKNDMEFYSKRLRDYLQENKELFPEYGACSCNSLTPQKNVYRTSLVIPEVCNRYGYKNLK